LKIFLDWNSTAEHDAIVFSLETVPRIVLQRSIRERERKKGLLEQERKKASTLETRVPVIRLLEVPVVWMLLFRCPS
jgi:hypothetical protein